MSVPIEPVVLRKNANAENAVIATGGEAVLSIIGVITTEIVAVEIPVNETPSVGKDWSIDNNNNSLWTPFKQEGEALTLTSETNVIRLPGSGVIRLKKSAGVSGNAYGVRRM